MKHRAWIAAALLACALPLATADESQVQLKDDPSRVLVIAGCSACHSADYIQMNSPFMSHAGWTAEVRKMIDAMGAPIPEENVAPIVNYLTRYYGVK